MLFDIINKGGRPRKGRCVMMIPSKPIREWLKRHKDIVAEAFYGDEGFGQPMYEIYFNPESGIDLEELVGNRSKYTLREETAKGMMHYLKQLDRLL